MYSCLPIPLVHSIKHENEGDIFSLCRLIGSLMLTGFEAKINLPVSITLQLLYLLTYLLLVELLRSYAMVWHMLCYSIKIDNFNRKLAFRAEWPMRDHNLNGN